MPSIRRVALILIGTAVQFGFAVLGWGGPVAFFAAPARIALAVALLAVAGAAAFAGGNLSSGVREDRGNRWVLPVFGVIGLVDMFLPPWTERRGFWILDGDALRWIGVFLFVVGAAVRLWPVYVLGHRFSGLVAIQPGHRLVTTGIYSVIRNPSYLGLLVGTLGWGLAFRSGVGVLLAALLIPPLVARMHAEERLLRTEFGAEYDAYFARTSRLVPGLY